MYEKFTERARKIMQLANQEAQRFNHEYIGTEHVFLGLIKEGNGVAANVLKNLNVDLRKARLGVESLVQSGPEMITIGKLPQTPRCKKVIEYAMEERENLLHNFLGSEHLLLGLLREKEGVAAQVLVNLELQLDDVREEILNTLGRGDANLKLQKNKRGQRLKKKKEVKRLLERHAIDLVEQHRTFPRHIELDQAIVRRLLASLTRTTANNVFLAGDLYTCEEYVRHLASLIATEKMPAPLAKHSIYELGDSARHSKFNEVCMDAGKSGNVILSTDLFSGAESGKHPLIQTLDTKRYWFCAPLVKFIVSGPVESWSEIQNVWPRVADSFCFIQVPEPGDEAVKSIVEFERHQLQMRHGVSFSDDAVEAAIQQTDEIESESPRFVKAIEILDYAAASSRLFSSTPLSTEQQSKHDTLVNWFNRMHMAIKEGNNDRTYPQHCSRHQGAIIRAGLAWGTGRVANRLSRCTPGDSMASEDCIGT